jgi:hypothetical protein
MSTEFTRMSVNDWEVESLRATAFHAQNEDLDPGVWWKGATETEPETQLIQAKGAEKRLLGAFSGGQLTLLLRPGRIDWLLGRSSNADEQMSAELISSVGRFVEIVSRFTEVVNRWLPMSPPLSRIAFGAVLLLPVPDRVTGYRKLAPYLPAVTIDPEGSRDLLYRINRPRTSQIGTKDLQLNRLSTWAVGSFEFKAFSVSGGQAIVTPGERAFACRVELDMNTAAEYRGQFVPEQLPATLKELVDLGVEITEKGDVP